MLEALRGLAMDGSHFDTLARTVTAAGSRRRVLTGLVLGSLGLRGALTEQAAARTCKKIKNKAKRKKCLAKARLGANPLGPSCPEGKKICAGTCIPSNQCCADADCGPDAPRCCRGTCMTAQCCTSGDCAPNEACVNFTCTCELAFGSCGHGRFCNGDTLRCEACRPSGGSCTFANGSGGSSDYCCSSLCSSGTCVGRPAGMECTSDEQCASGICEPNCSDDNLCTIEKFCQPA
jgi:hypothetical protein